MDKTQVLVLNKIRLENCFMGNLNLTIIFLLICEKIQTKKANNRLDFFRKLNIMLELVYSSIKQTLDLTSYANWRSG
jgi:hypothetical protein